MALSLSSCFSFSLLLSLVLFFQSSSARINVNVLPGVVSQVCSKTRDATLCSTVLNADARTTTSDLFGLVSIANNLAFVYITGTKSNIDSQVSSTSDQNLKKIFADCSTRYQYALEALNAAAKNIQIGEYKEVVNEGSDCLDNVLMCDKQLKEPKPVQSPLTERNGIAATHCSILHAAADSLP